MSQTGWKSELSLLDEFFDQEPRYPLATEIEHQRFEFERQNKIIRDTSQSQKNAINESTNKICGSIENGFSELFNVNQNGFAIINKTLENEFDDLSFELSNINRNLEQISATLDWGFSNLISQLTITNNKLDKIIHLLNIPDSQKQRKYHIEQGFDFLKKSNFNPFFFNNAKENFEKALDIEQSDYLCHQQLGIIYLYSNELLDLKKSREHLKTSLIYSKAEIGFSKKNQKPSSFHFTFNPEKITSTSLMHLARNYSINNDYSLSIKLIKEAIQIYDMIELNFDISRYYCLVEDELSSIKHLEKAINKDRYISVKCLSDKTLITKPHVTDYLNSIASKTNKIALNSLLELEKEIHHNSIFQNQINKIKTLVQEQNYLSSLKALEEIGYELDN